MPGTYEKIATTTLGSAAATVTFSSIPATYTDLVLVAYAANTGSDAVNTGYMQYNSDSGNNYSDTIVYTEGDTPTSFRTTNSNAIGFWTIMGNTNSNRRSTIVVQFQNYSNTTTYKTTLNRIATATSSGGWTNMSVGTWRNTNAITSILVGGGTNWLSDSTFTLYGIKAA
jgi:hypothetical protein